MANIYVYNNQTRRNGILYTGRVRAMPYNIGRTLTVNSSGVPCKYDVDYKAGDGGFQHNKKCVGRPIYVGFAFKRIWEGAMLPCLNYAGFPLMSGQNLDSATRDQLRNVAAATGVWTYLEPAYLTPTWVHFDAVQPRRHVPLAVTRWCASAV